MYKFNRNSQRKFSDFNQPLGLEMDIHNRWIKLSETIPWDDIEKQYANLFPSNKGMPAKPVQTALGSLIIQKRYNYSDRELVLQIKENPYYQYFIGLPGYEHKQPFAPSLMVEFRKRLTDDILCEINEMILEYNSQDDTHSDDNDDDGNGDSVDSSSDSPIDTGNSGTLILDATCAPQNIAFPQDINLLNEAREKLEGLIDFICHENHYHKPRTYREKARTDYLNLAKNKRRTAKSTRKAIKKQLQYVKRDLEYITKFLSQGVKLTDKQLQLLEVLQTLFAQQKYMYDNNVHRVDDRIVSIEQPYIRPIVRGKAKSPTEFGAKLDMSIDENGIARLERLSFDAFNEQEDLIDAIERYHDRNGHYPERVLVDKIYRNKVNLAYCKSHGIRMSGPALGRPKKMTDEEKKQAYADNVDRIEVERGFSLAKRCCGLGLITTKLETTTRSSIALSIIVVNLKRLMKLFLCLSARDKSFLFFRQKYIYWKSIFEQNLCVAI